MMVIGAITRLSESGLSMTEWNLIGGTPPMTESDWEELFEKYKGTPQHVTTFPDMDLEGFKRIFWWEYIHRMFGRMLGLVFAIPFLWFLIRRRISFRLAGWLFLALILGAGQGFLGWIMVQSGLEERPWVSPVKLTAHLMLALTLFGLILALALSLRWRTLPSLPNGAEKKGLLTVGSVLLFIQLLLGGMMSGMRSALDFPTFPTMGGQWIPAFLWKPELGWLNWLENSALIHFTHRGMAVAVLVALGWFAWTRYRLPERVDSWLSRGLLAALVAQITLGIWTVLQARGAVPEVPGVLHQIGAIVLVGLVVAWWVRHYGAGKEMCQ